MADVPATEKPLEALRHTARLLAESYERARVDLVREIDQFHSGLNAQPENMRDQQGRYILLDALTALVHANTVLTSAELSDPPETMRT